MLLAYLWSYSIWRSHLGQGKQNDYARTQCEGKQYSVACAITCSSKYCPNTSSYKTLIFLQLEDIYQLELAKFMYQLHHKKFLTALNGCFVDIANIHSHYTGTKHGNLVYFKLQVQTSVSKKIYDL